MKKAIEYLKTLGIKCSPMGVILSVLPKGERGITLVNMLEDNTVDAEDESCWTIVIDHLQKISI